MKRLFIVIFIFLGQLYAVNPIIDFIKNNHNITGEKFVLITLNIQNCGNCSYPISSIVREIKQINRSIPIYLITNENLSRNGKEFYLNQIGLNPDSISLIFNRELYMFLIKKTKQVDNISVVTSNGKIKVIRKINNKLNMKSILDEFNDRLYMKVTEVLPINNTITDYSGSYSAIIFNKSKFIIFKRGINIISIYDYNGNYKNLYLDTLHVFNMSFFRSILTVDEFNNSVHYYTDKKMSTNKILLPVSIFKVSEKEFGITYYLKIFKDSLYQKDSVIYEFTKAFVIILDTNFQITKTLKFNDNTIASKMILESQSSYADSTFYFIFAKGINKYALGQFRINNNSELIMDSLKVFYFSTSKKAKLPVIQNSNTNDDVFFVVYDNKWGKEYSNIFQIKKNDKTVRLCSKMKKYIYGSMVYQTEYGNLIYGVKYKKKLLCIEKLVLNNNDNSLKKYFNGQIHFLYNGRLYRISYSEK